MTANTAPPAARPGLVHSSCSCPAHDQDAALRQARVAGMVQGLMLALIAHLVGLILLTLIDAHWPVACDGTASLGSCAARLMGVA